MTTPPNDPTIRSPILSGLLAYGMSGQVFHAPFLTTHPGFQLLAATERSRKCVQADYPGVRSYPTIEQLLADPEIELVVVNTPNATHSAYAQQALRAGKHVLIEKPMAASAQEVRAIYALGREMNRSVFLYQNRRYDSDFRVVEAVVRSGRLGRLVEAHFRFDRFRLGLSPKAFKETPGPATGLHYDLGPHVLDQALSLFGPPAHVHPTLGTYRPDSRVCDYFSYQLRYPDGLNVHVGGSLLVASPGPAYVLHGTGGSFRKARADVQEAQLAKGLLPSHPAFGQEDPALAGELTLADSGGILTTEPVAALPGSYGALFDAIYQTLRHRIPFPVKEEEQVWQAEILGGYARQEAVGGK